MAEVGLVVGEIDSQGLGQLAGTVAELEIGLTSASGAHLLDPVGRLQRPDQDGGCLSFGFGDGVEQAVDPVGEVDVGVAGRAEEDPGALGKTDVGVAGGVVGLVALGLDDDAAAASVEEGAADQVSGDVVDRAVEEVSPQRLCEPLGPASGPQVRLLLQPRSSWARAWTAASVSRASSIWRASGAEPVPPAIRFDSSQLLCCRTS